MENSRTIHSVSGIKFYRNSAIVIFILFIEEYWANSQLYGGRDLYLCRQMVEKPK